METQAEINYKKIAKAIEYLQDHYQEQPQLNEVADAVGWSATHFQKVFKEWAGVSPKSFLQYLSIEHAKSLLNKPNSNVVETTVETGLSSTSRLNDLFVKIEGMTPAEYKNGGKNLQISYQWAQTKFGKILAASTEKGLCFIAFDDEENVAFKTLKQKFPNALLEEKNSALQENALQIFQDDWKNLSQIKLHLKGTDFQIKVWESLLKIPQGKLATYRDIAENVGNAKASRAVGTAIGNNPIAFLIPCHRVIQATGNLGEYRWGKVRKASIIGWEQANDHQ